MGIISDIGGLALSAGGAIAGLAAGANAAKNIRQNVANAQQANTDWYNRRYNEDATQKADAQRLLTMTEQSILNRNKQAAGASAVAGGTEESVAAQKAAGNQLMADAVSQINASAEAQKAAIEQQYQARNDAYTDQLNQMEQNRSNNIAQAVQGVTAASGNIMSTGALDNIFGKK